MSGKVVVVINQLGMEKVNLAISLPTTCSSGGTLLCTHRIGEYRMPGMAFVVLNQVGMEKVKWAISLPTTCSSGEHRPYIIATGFLKISFMHLL